MKEVIDYGVLVILGFLSIVVVCLAIERIWFYGTVRVENYLDKRFLELDLHKRLTLIATIGSNAPYVGLLGTVGGIMITFVEIGADSSVDTGAIMTGLSLALKATAAGLIVAIPSIVAYNLLTRKADVVLTLWDIHHKPYTEPAKATMNRQISNAQIAQRTAPQQATPQQISAQQVAQMQQRQMNQTAQPNPQRTATTQQAQLAQNQRMQSSVQGGVQGSGSATTTPRI